jgi:phage baseplate assembly protein gpV
MDGAIAALIANSKTDTSAAITANVTRNTSNITLSADKIYLDADTTLANTIQATQGSIGGFTISQNSLSAE